jgi:hypothetical protein
MSNTKKRTLAVVSAGVVIVALGGTGVALASGNSGPDKPPTSASTGSETELNDGPNQGPDANPNEPGHQDANEAQDATESKDAAEGPEDPSDDTTKSGTDAGDPNQLDGEHADS